MLARSLKLFIFLAIAGLAALVGGDPAAAQTEEAEQVTIDVRAGFEGYYKSEFWVPVRVKVANQGPLIEGAIEINTGDAAGGDEVIYRSPLILPTQSNKEVTLAVYLPGYTSELNASLVDNQGRVIKTAASGDLDRLGDDSLLYGILSPEMDELEQLDNSTGGRSDAAAALLEVRDLPELGVAWNSLDVVVVHGVESGRLGVERLDALKSWIETGGQLVVIGGPEWQKATTGLEDILPVEATGLRAIDELTSLSASTGVNFRDEGPYLVTESELLEGELLLHQDGLPLLARRDMGRGSVYFLALDPELAPLADWDGSELLWSEIASRAPILPTWALGAKNGYSADTALSSLPSAALPSALLLFSFLFFYVLAVGPANYLILKRVGKRELAWVTIPVLVLLFSAAAYLVGLRLKGNDIIINQMSIVFGQAGENSSRVQSLIGLYSPRRSHYDLALPGSSAARPFDQNFGSLAGSGSLDAVVQENETVLEGVRVDVGGIETFAADSIGDAVPIGGRALLRINNDKLFVESTIQNDSDATLENAILVVGRTVTPIGDLHPGEVREIQESISVAQLPAGGGGLGSPSVIGPIYSPGTTGSLLAAHYDDLLGTNDYYNDPEAFARWQLLQSIIPEYGAAPYVIPQGTATLVGWTTEQQLETTIREKEIRTEGTTLYFIELPISQTEVTGSNITIPEALIEWQVLGQSGVYDPQVTDLYLTHGWVEFEYQPWSHFHDLSPTEMALFIAAPSGSAGKPLPMVQLWDWTEGAWITLDDASWGSNEVAAYERYIGSANRIRVRLHNDSVDGIEIKKVYPQITGDSS